MLNNVSQCSFIKLHYRGLGRGPLIGFYMDVVSLVVESPEIELKNDVIITHLCTACPYVFLMHLLSHVISKVYRSGVPNEIYGKRGVVMLLYPAMSVMNHIRPFQPSTLSGLL